MDTAIEPSNPTRRQPADGNRQGSRDATTTTGFGIHPGAASFSPTSSASFDQLSAEASGEVAGGGDNPAPGTEPAADFDIAAVSSSTSPRGVVVDSAPPRQAAPGPFSPGDSRVHPLEAPVAIGCTVAGRDPAAGGEPIGAVVKGSEASSVLGGAGGSVAPVAPVAVAAAAMSSSNYYSTGGKAKSSRSSSSSSSSSTWPDESSSTSPPAVVSISFELRSSLSTYSWDSIEAMCVDDEDEATKDKKKGKKKDKKKGKKKQKAKAKYAFNSHKSFVGIRGMKKALFSQSGRGHGNLERFQAWAKAGQWRRFGPSHSHYDWWMFPIDRRSAGTNYKYTVYSGDIRRLKHDREYMDGYLLGVELVCRSWGWDVRAAAPVPDPDVKAGQVWKHWTVRLFKMGLSLQLFGEDELFASVTRFARMILIPTVERGRMSTKKQRRKKRRRLLQRVHFETRDLFDLQSESASDSSA